MGKNPKSILKVSEWSIYPIILKSKPDKEGYCGVLIRITNRKKSTDIEVYDQKGQRIKVKSEHFINGKMIGGYDQSVINSYNRIIDSIKLNVAEYISTNQHFNKDLLLQHSYPTDFLNNHKRKRTKYITIPVQHRGKVYDSIELESKEIKELIDPYISKQTFINSDGKTKTIEGIFDSETGESVIESEDDYNELVVSAKLTKDEYKKRLQHLEEIESWPPLERYKKGEYFNNNIFHVAGQILFLNKNEKAKKPFSKNWKMAVMKLFDYRSRFQPKENVSDISVEWITNVITAIKEHGYSTAHPKNFNPFKYNPDIFAKSKTAYYNDLSLEKFIKNIKEVFRWLCDQNQLPPVAIDKIKYEDFNLSKVTQHTKKDYYLTKEEFDKLFTFKFDDDDKFSKADLSKARDLFILQTYLGGLRPNELYNDNVTILDDGKGKKKVHYYISKDGKVENENPICSYSDLVLKKYSYKFENILIDYPIYCKLLKAIAAQVFDRIIIKTEERNGKKHKLKLNIQDEFESYFARKTFQMLLKEEAGISDYDIKAFTGHKANDIQGHYTTFTVKRKREIMEKIEPIPK